MVGVEVIDIFLYKKMIFSCFDLCTSIAEHMGKTSWLIILVTCLCLLAFSDGRGKT